jgi:hypothetical protein
MLRKSVVYRCKKALLDFPSRVVSLLPGSGFLRVLVLQDARTSSYTVSLFLNTKQAIGRASPEGLANSFLFTDGLVVKENHQ